MSWFSIVRLGGAQAAIGAMVMLCTSLLNRVMVVEYAMAASVPAGLVAWHYAVQLSRPVWGHGSDKGRRRTPWIIGGMAVLASGAMLAVYATVSQSMVLAVLAFTLIGAGVGAAGTSLLAVLATQTRPDQRAAAAWTGRSSTAERMTCSGTRSSFRRTRSNSSARTPRCGDDCFWHPSVTWGPIVG